MGRIREKIMEYNFAKDRREFFKSTGKGIAAAGALMAAVHAMPEPAYSRTRGEKLKRIASNCWGVRHLFKRRQSTRSRRQMSEEQRKRWN